MEPHDNPARVEGNPNLSLSQTVISRLGPGRSGRRPAVAPADRHPVTSELSGQRALVHTEVCRHRGQGKARGVALSRTRHCVVRHLASVAPTGDTSVLEMGDHGGAVDLEVAGDSIDRGAHGIRLNQLRDLGYPPGQLQLPDVGCHLIVQRSRASNQPSKIHEPTSVELGLDRAGVVEQRARPASDATMGCPGRTGGGSARSRPEPAAARLPCTPNARRTHRPNCRSGWSVAPAHGTSAALAALWTDRPALARRLCPRRLRRNEPVPGDLPRRCA